LHSRAEHVPASFSYQAEAEPMVAVADAVDEQPHASARAADEDVGPSVVVHVPKGNSSTDVRYREHAARTARDVLESAVSQIPVQLVGHAQRERLLRSGLRLNGRDAAIGDEQIEPAIVVEVEPPGSEAGLRQAGSPQA